MQLWFSVMKRLLLVFVALFINACASTHDKTGTANTSEYGGESGVVKSENDTRAYRYLELDNGLRVLLISDLTADKAAASLDINIGSGADPFGRPGLAHFLEHMLFLGTTKYPEAGEYQAFLDANGGSHNAYTSYEHTNYFFDVDPSQFSSALDRFSQFFISPLFTEQYVDREKHAVNSEYKAKIKDDFRRNDEVFKATLNPRHPLSKFSVGSLETFAEQKPGELRDSLLDFYQTYYSANLMTLVLLSKESLDELEHLVKDKFSPIPNRQTPHFSPAVNFFEPNVLPIETHNIPEKELRLLSLRFPMPSHKEYYRSKPLAYIGNIIGHEGKGSLLSLLKKQGYAESLSAGIGRATHRGSFFSINITLTELGVKHYNDIIGLVFQTVNRIRQSGPQRWLFEEQKTIADISFRFQEKYDAISYVRSLADVLHDVDAHDVLRAGYMMEEFLPGVIDQFLEYLNPDNMLIALVSPGLTTNLQSQYYSVPYLKRPVNADRLSQWKNVGLNDAVRMPQPNEFIPRQVQLVPLEDNISEENSNNQDKPALLKQTSDLTLWYLQDKQFRVPKGNLYFTVRSALVRDSVANAALTQLYVALINDQLSEFGYPANLAGLNYSVIKHTRGFSIEIHGYTDKQITLLEKIANTITDFKPDPQRFDNVKTELIRQWRNYSKKIPYQQVLREIPHLLYKKSWTDLELADALEDKTAAQLNTFIDEFLTHGVTVEGLLHGNYAKSGALELAEVIEKELLTHKRTTPVEPVRVAVIEGTDTLLRPLPIDHEDSVVTWYLQGTDRSANTRAYLALITQALKSAFYKELRTEKQLGYIVFNGAMPLLDVPGVVFVVQSPHVKPDALMEHIDNFIHHQVTTLESMSLKQFEQYKESLITLIAEAPKNLYQQSERYWRNVILKDYDFNRRDELLQATQNITHQAFIEYYKRTFAASSRRDLWLYSDKPEVVIKVTNGKSTRESVVVRQVQSFKDSSQYYSLP